MAEDFSKQALLNFLDYEKDKGLVKENTIASRKAAVNAVLGILDDDEIADVRNMDLDSVMSRFANKREGDFSPDSLRVYKSRVLNAVEDFVRYRENPAGFKPGVVTRQRAAQKAEGSVTASTKKQNLVDEPVQQGAVSFPIPIRPDTVVRLVGIPSDLTKREATKIANIVMALAISEEE